MRRIRFLGIVAILLSVLAVTLITSCSPATVTPTTPGETSIPTPGETTAPETTEPIGTREVIIGLVGEFTGAYAPNGGPHRDSIRNGVKIINEDGGFTINEQNYTIKLIEYDSRNDPKRGVAGMTMLKDMYDIKMVIGSFSSQCTLATQPIVEARHILQINAGASTVVTRPGLRWSWSMAQSTDYRAYASVPYWANVLGAKSVGMITENEAFCLSGRDSFKAQFEKYGVQVVADEVYESNVQDYSTIHARIRQKDPDILFINGVAGNNIINTKQVRQSGWEVMIVGQIDLVTDQFFVAAGHAANEVSAMGSFNYWDYKAGRVPEKMITMMGTDMDLYYKVSESYKAQYGENQMGASNNGYMEVSAFVEAMKKAGTVDDEDVLRDNFEGLEWQDSMKINKILLNHRMKTYIPIYVYFESTVGADKRQIVGFSYHTDDMQEQWVSEKVADWKTIEQLRSERGY